MKYLSFDIEATGLRENDYIIEFGMVPFCAKSQTFADDLKKHFYIHCPSFDSLENELDPWVIKHNKELIIKANSDGISLANFKQEISSYVKSAPVQEYFTETSSTQKKSNIILFGKSLNAIDLPFLNRDLGYAFMREHFHYQVHDLSSIVMNMVDLNCLPEKCLSGSELMQYFNLGDVCHTALEDAYNTAKLYFHILNKCKK